VAELRVATDTSAPLVVHVVGARPNYMKIAPVYAALERRGRVRQLLVHTGQHYDRNVREVFFDELPLPKPHVQLHIGSGGHGEQTGRALIELERVFQELEPQLVVVPGDVNSTLAGALGAVKLGIPVCHLEAGLRSFDAAMPEEHNRRVTDHVSSLLLAPSADGVDNLAAEGIAGEHVVLVGNTMIDTLLMGVERARQLRAWEEYGLGVGRYVLATLHRPALVDVSELLAATLGGLGSLARSFPVIFPIHPRTRARLDDLGLRAPPGVILAEPQPYGRFLSLQCGAAAVVTDSGGVQEETTVLGIPCFTLRENTERPVTVTHGTNVVLGLAPERLAEIPGRLARPRKSIVPPLWDGAAGDRAATAIETALSTVAAWPADVVSLAD
jgi:UDP-N-acetylglucosamine 2-epimerase (non-hydrolysing)